MFARNDFDSISNKQAWTTRGCVEILQLPV